MRSPRAVLLLAALVFCAGNVAATLCRSTIPLELDGVVTRLETRSEKHPGIDDVHLLHLSSRETIQVDAEVAHHLRRGDRVVKRRWGTRLTTQRGSFALTPSADLRGMLAAMPLVLALTVLASRRKRSGRDGAG